MSGARPLRARLAAALRRVAAWAPLLAGGASVAAAAPAQDLDATLTCEPAEARIGEPLTWTLLVWHDVDEQLLPVDGLVPPDDTWVLLDGPHRARVESGEGALTRVQWSVMSLDPGARALPALDLTLDGGVTLTARAGEVRVLGELAEGEDAPRPLPEPPGAPPAEGAPWLLLVPPAMYLGGVALVLVFVGRMRGRRLAELRATGGPGSADLAGLPVPGTEDLDALRAHARRLCRTLRGDLERPGIAVPAGLEDHEWAAHVRTRGHLDEDHARRAEALLQELEAVEYGGAVPVPEELEAWRARALELEREVRARRGFEDPGAPAPVGAAAGEGTR